ncbi:MAG: putative NH(3)-dependent NAD(+) synthetase [Microgenomates group bacterium GW2011_GWA2_46_7]|nr:MAG: putative NH(3)-dependent NAD(+) synthetase [Microgenomates group bacterium GW2011_GWA2_46_7]
MRSKIEQIVSWLKEVIGEKSAVIGVSGGVDSAVVLTLVTQAIGKERVIPLLLPYGEQEMGDAKLVSKFNGVEERMRIVNIQPMVEEIVKNLKINDQIRKSNVMARVRMITLFDTAKTEQGLVVGTENRSERELGYYTRFGDSASDVEPIVGLYKTEIWEMAKELGLPEIFYTKKPSAELWAGQSDEEEMGFSYQEADRVLRGELEGVEERVRAQVRERVDKQKFKKEVPYEICSDVE